MNLDSFIEHLRNNKSIRFDDTILIIDNYYLYQPDQFTNGIGDDKIVNKAKTNESSCKIFAFALHHKLNQQQTLNLFGEHYKSVLSEPDGTTHQNIRNFIKYGWAGINIQQDILTKKCP